MMSADFWKHINTLPPDEFPLSEEEKRDIADSREFMDWEEFKRELEM